MCAWRKEATGHKQKPHVPRPWDCTQQPEQVPQESGGRRKRAAGPKRPETNAPEAARKRPGTVQKGAEHRGCTGHTKNKKEQRLRGAHVVRNCPPLF